MPLVYGRLPDTIIYPCLNLARAAGEAALRRFSSVHHGLDEQPNLSEHPLLYRPQATRQSSLTHMQATACLNAIRRREESDVLFTAPMFRLRLTQLSIQVRLMRTRNAVRYLMIHYHLFQFRTLRMSSIY